MKFWRAAIMLALCLLAARAAAHDLPIERQAVLQIHPTHAELLLVYTEPPGPRTDRLMALHDADRNGRIDGVEGKLAKPSMIRRAFLGLDIEFQHATTKNQEPEVRYKRTKGGGLSTAILRRTDIIPNDKELGLQISLIDSTGVPNLELIVEVASGWKFADNADTQRRTNLTPGKDVQVEFVRSEPTARPRGERPDWRPPELPQMDTL